MITSKAPIFNRLSRWFRFRRGEKKREALKRLGQAIEMPRKDGRIDAIRKAWDAYMDEVYPVNKRKVRRAV